MAYHAETLNNRIRELTDPTLSVVNATGLPDLYMISNTSIKLPDDHTRPLIVVTGPSRSGKDSIISQVLNTATQFQRVKTATTRSRRADEPSDAKTWMRTRLPEESRESYANALETEYDLIECTTHNNHVYGLPRANLTNLAASTIPILDTDVTGIKKLRLALGGEFAIISFLICPENAQQLEVRTQQLGTDVSERLEMAQQYLEEAPSVVNFVLHNRFDDDVNYAIERSTSQLLAGIGQLGLQGSAPQLLAKQ